MTSGPDGLGEPSWWACHAVGAAARVLPSQAHRERYRQEFVAELYGMARAQQNRHATDVVLRAWALRTALRNTALPITEEDDMKTKPRRPIRCRLNLHHKWKINSTEDGTRWQTCEWCGKDRRDPPVAWG